MLHADVQSLQLSLSANDITPPNAIVVSLCLAVASGVRLTSYFIKQEFPQGMLHQQATAQVP
jgi:hypothetical protein